MTQQKIKNFVSNNAFCLFVGVLFAFILTCVFADSNTGSHTKQAEDHMCTPENSKCEGGVSVNMQGSDGCTKTLLPWECSGTCYWCDPSSDRGRYCKEYEKRKCIIVVGSTTMSCGARRPHKCEESGGHGISKCCPAKDKNITPAGDCTGIATCIDIDD